MAMEIKDSSYYRAQYVQQQYLQQQNAQNPVGLAEKPKETDTGQASKKTASQKAADQTPVLKDGYISSEKTAHKPSGLYRVGQDGHGNRKVFFDSPSKPGRPDGENQPQAKPDSVKEGSREGQAGSQPKVKPGQPQKKEEVCVGSTDKVDREIEKLKAKKKQLEQQIQQAKEDVQKTRKLEKELAQVENELNQKDNGTYRRQHMTVTG